jgi:hypothetical protein
VRTLTTRDRICSQAFAPGCGVCEEGGADFYCITCDPSGLPLHEKCWEWVPRHRRFNSAHLKASVPQIHRYRYLTELSTPLPCAERNPEDAVNCFAWFGVEDRKFHWGPRAFSRYIDDFGPRSSLISFIGCPAAGKSFLLRALMYGGPSDEFPVPTPDQHRAPGPSGIDVYDDWRTAGAKSPILFLECNGCEHTDAPCTTVPLGTGANLRGSYKHLYNCLHHFSTCIVFVTSRPLADIAEVGRGILAHNSGSSRGAFKPTLFVVFNYLQNDVCDWSIKSSTRTFLGRQGLPRQELLKLYESIYVVCIPTVRLGNSSISLLQIDAFHRELRRVHDRALRSRQKSDLGLKTIKRLVLALSMCHGSDSGSQWKTICS